MDEQTQTRADRWKDWMGVMVAVVALITAIAAWRAASTARLAGLEDYFALTATLNNEQARIVSTGDAVHHLTAFTDFVVNAELASQFRTDLKSRTNADRQSFLQAQAQQAERLAATNRNFFPGRYAAQDGTYAIQREITERVADADREQDLNAEAHLEGSNALDDKTYGFIQTIILLSVALFSFTLAGAFNYARRWLRWGAAAVGGVLLIASIVLVLVIEFA